jgi:ATP-dependent Lhr-like helicase
MSEIPDLQTLLIEVITRDGAAEYYLHTPLHRAGNDALVRVAVRRLVRGDGRRAHALVTDLGLVLAVAGKELVAEDFRRLLSVQGFEADLSAALAESEALRQRFQRVAMTGLMLLRNPLGGRRRVGGSDWGERRLFDQVRSAEPGFVLLRQAERELRREVCDVAAAGRYLEGLPRRMVRCRRLAQISPFVESWGPVDPGPAEAVETPGEALQRLHASLMGTGPV